MQRAGKGATSVSLWLVVLMIVAPAAFPSLTLWANNLRQVPHPYKVMLVAAGFTLVGTLIYLLLQRIVEEKRIAAYVTFFVLIALSSGARITPGESWALRWLLVIAFILIVTMIVFRLSGSWLLDYTMTGLALALLLPPLLSVVWATWTSGGDSQPVELHVMPPQVMSATPDIVLIVVDGYTSLPVIRDFFAYEDPHLITDLHTSGFRVVEPAFSAYPMTHLSISSLLDLDYVVEDAMSVESGDGRSLVQIISGNSSAVDLLSSNGYSVTMVESGWHLSTCGPRIDSCVPASFIDEGVGAVLSQSMIWSALEPVVGSAFTHGSLRAMEWTVEHLGGLVRDQSADFIFVHVLAPHPPLLLDNECQIAASDRHLVGPYMNVGGVSAEVARRKVDAYVEQVRCVNRFVRDVADIAAGSDSVVVITGDHGSDALSQLVTPPAEWTGSQLVERLGVFLAIKAPEACLDPDSRITVPIFRSVLACSTGLDLGGIEDRAFVVSLAEDGGGSPVRYLSEDDIATLASLPAPTR